MWKRIDAAVANMAGKINFRMREQKHHQYLGRYGAYSGAEARRCERVHSYGSIARAKIALDTKGRNLQMAQMAWASHSRQGVAHRPHTVHPSRASGSPDPRRTCCGTRRAPRSVRPALLIMSTLRSAGAGIGRQSAWHSSAAAQKKGTRARWLAPPPWSAARNLR